MLGLSLWQPWAGVIVHGPKRIENRSWSPSERTLPRGTRFALHASARYDVPSEDILRERYPQSAMFREGPLTKELKAQHYPTSCIVGVATLVDVLRSVDEVKKRVPDQLEWWAGPLALLLGDVVALKTPVHVSGARGFWLVPSRIERMVLSQLP